MERRGPQEQRRGLQGQETQEPQTRGISTGRGELAQPRGAEAETRAGGPKSLSLVGGGGSTPEAELKGRTIQPETDLAQSSSGLRSHQGSSGKRSGLWDGGSPRGPGQRGPAHWHRKSQKEPSRHPRGRVCEQTLG